MKNLIVYSSMYGTTERCARLLAEKLDGETVIADASAKDVPSPAEFDTVILGSSVKVGRVGKPMRKYLMQYGELLYQKRRAFFLCSGDTDRDYFALNFAEPLLSGSAGAEYFGGALDLDKLSWLLRKILNKIGVKESYDRIDPEKITALAAALNG